MLIVKRAKGAIVSTLVASLGEGPSKVTAAPAKPAAPVKVASPKGSAKTPKSNSPKAQPPRDASPGAKLAFKLAAALTNADDTERNRLCYKLGRHANEIGPGDPDVAAALANARKDQASFRQDGHDRSAAENSDDAFYSWSAAFIAGYHAKVNAKGVSTPKPYRLTVTIEGFSADPGRKLDAVEGEEHTARFEKFGDAHRAACRWFTVKSDVAHRMTVVIDTLDLNAAVPGEDIPAIPSLAYNVTIAEARDAMNAVQRRQDKGPIVFTPKVGGRNLGFGVKVKESRCKFSRG